MQKRTGRQPQAEPVGQGPVEHDLIADCAAALERLATPHALVEPVEADWKGPHRPDACVRVRIGGHATDYVVEVKQTLREAAIGPLTHLARGWAEAGQRLLLCTTRVPDRLGEQLREQGIDYLDADGNAHLHGPGMLVVIRGRRPTRRAAERAGLRGTDVRLLGVFLRDRDAGEQVQAELARRAGVALGAVGKAREHLVQLGVLEPAGPRRWQVRDRAAGLRRFGDGWAALVRGRLRPRAYRLLAGRGPETLDERVAAAAPELGILLGGEHAAGHLTDFLWTDHATLHAPRGARRHVAEALDLVPDEGGPITLLDRYGTGDEFALSGADRALLAHPLLVWAECLTVRDERVAQAAQRLLEQLLEHD